MSETNPAAPEFTVYWRPGCGFCSRLFRQLQTRDLDPVVRNIWDDDEARRFLNDRIGSETVPTVVVGGSVLVNPDIGEVLDALAGVNPTAAGR
ncbi:glutaredoxin family protein [Rhabdothermincola salaria]|uniref:glutaredoxin family protein n=1 Tax=Rhabdothermincola salaria TaxID=2903142 RepID=UPI001E62B007|nr:glutaredoxin [Rhabdothermincola salaria]MCD9624503.1 glutaredoxin [Rhabdothermincola salaria]